MQKQSSKHHDQVLQKNKLRGRSGKKPEKQNKKPVCSSADTWGQLPAAAGATGSAKAAVETASQRHRPVKKPQEKINAND
jgi:hypothetical protein